MYTASVLDVLYRETCNSLCSNSQNTVHENFRYWYAQGSRELVGSPILEGAIVWMLCRRRGDIKPSEMPESMTALTNSSLQSLLAAVFF